MAGASEALTMDDWLKFLQSTITKFLKVGVPTRLRLQVVSPHGPDACGSDTCTCFSPAENLLVQEAGGPCHGHTVAWVAHE